MLENAPRFEQPTTIHDLLYIYIHIEINKRFTHTYVLSIVGRIGAVPDSS